MPNEKYRIGIIGAGYIADWHIKALKSVKNVTIAAICDINSDNAEKIAITINAKSFANIDDLIKTKEVNAVQILTPPHTHFVLAKKALGAGLHVYMEKPMCTSASECEELIRLADNKNLKLGIGHNFLFYPTYEKLRDLVKNGELGFVQEITIAWHQELPQHRFGPFDTWMLADPTNIMLEIGSHSFSQLIDLCGIPTELVQIHPDREITLPGNKRFYRRWNVNVLCEQTAVHMSFDFQAGFPEHYIKVRGSLGTAKVDFAANTLSIKRDTTFSMDLNRYCVSNTESRHIRKWARTNLINYVLGKANLSEKENIYGYSIMQALKSFYSMSETQNPDNRISSLLGRNTIKLAEDIGKSETIQLNELTKQVTADNIKNQEEPAKILIFGGTGFIGQELLKQLLSQGHNVKLFTRKIAAIPFAIPLDGLIVQQGSIFNPDDLDLALRDIDIVYNLAVARAETWQEWLDTDVKATKLIAEKCLEHKVKRLIYTGTIDSYWSGDSSSVITEVTGLDNKIASRNYYARAKALNEENLMIMHRTQGLPLVIVRPGIVIGKGSSPIHWGVGMWNGLGVVQVWDNGDNKLPLVLVEDTAAALVKCLDCPSIEGDSFNLIGEPLVSAKEYLTEIEKRMKIKLQIHFVAPIKFFAADVFKWLVKVVVRHPGRARKPSYRDFDSRSHKAQYDCNKAKTILGWAPERDKVRLIEKGIYKPCDELLK